MEPYKPKIFKNGTILGLARWKTDLTSDVDWLTHLKTSSIYTIPDITLYNEVINGCYKPTNVDTLLTSVYPPMCWFITGI